MTQAIRCCAVLLLLMIMSITEASPYRDKHVYAPLTLHDYITLSCTKTCVDQESLLTSVAQSAKESEIDARILLAIIRVESSFSIRAKNGKSVGLTQVNLQYHKPKFNGRNYHDVNDNIRVGSMVLRDCLNKHNGNLTKALGCYNGSQRGVYARKVYAAYKEIRKLVDLERTS